MKNIIITGGELFNKGAQAMVFVTVDECKKRFPDHEIYLLSPMDMQRTEKEKEQYTFKFMGWYPIKFAKAQNNKLLDIICRMKNSIEYKEALNIYKNCDMMIDISGYALGSNWSYDNCNIYLEHIEFARAFNIPVYIMPQSFGPFNFETCAEELNKRIFEDMTYAKIVFAREKVGYDALQSVYGLKNIQIETDIVLNNQQIDKKNIFFKSKISNVPDIKDNSVAIIPNGRILDILSESRLLEMYQLIIDNLLEFYHVYIISHSSMDAKLCQKIKSLYSDQEKVVLLDYDFNCLEYTEIVKKMQFIIASRFHSIVHAFKEGIPCISIGWAIKYHDLLTKFGQEAYSFDVRDNIDYMKLREAITRLRINRDVESNIIKKHLSLVQNHNVFDILSMEK